MTHLRRRELKDWGYDFGILNSTKALKQNYLIQGNYMVWAMGISVQASVNQWHK